MYDMICIYEMTESFKKPVFQEGYKLSYYPTGQIRLPNNFRYTAGSRYTIRYEHKWNKNSTCQWIQSSSVTKEGFSKQLEPHEVLNVTQTYVGIYVEPNVWGSITLWWPKMEEKIPCDMLGSPPKSFLEISINGWIFTVQIALLPTMTKLFIQIFTVPLIAIQSYSRL